MSSDEEYYDSDDMGPEEPVEVIGQAKVLYAFEATNDVELDLDVRFVSSSQADAHTARRDH